MRLLLYSYPWSIKVGIFGLYFYVQEVIILIFVLTLILLRKYSRDNLDIINKVLLLHVFLITNYLLTGNEHVLSYIKHLSIFYFLLIPREYLEKVSVEKIFYYWIFIGIINLTYIAINYGFNPASALSFLFEYNPKYRIIGLTGTGVDLFSFELRTPFRGTEIGTTTISLSILFSFIGIYYFYATNRCALKISFVCLCLSFFTMSRTGVLCYLIALGSYFVRAKYERYRLLRIMFIIVMFFILIFLITYNNLGINKLNIDKAENIITVLLRMEYWRNALDFLIANPETIIFGATSLGYSIYDVLYFYYAESLFLDLFIHVGLFPTILMLFIFYNIFYNLGYSSSFRSDLPLTMQTFGTAFLFANLFAGSPMFTDFFVPIILTIVIKFRKN